METKKDFLTTNKDILFTKDGLDGEIIKGIDTFGNIVKESFTFGHPLEKNLKNERDFQYNQMLTKLEMAIGSGFCEQLEIEREMFSSVQRLGGLPSSLIHLQNHLSIESTIKPYDYLKGPFQCDFNYRVEE